MRIQVQLAWPIQTSKPSRERSTKMLKLNRLSTGCQIFIRFSQDICLVKSQDFFSIELRIFKKRKWQHWFAGHNVKALVRIWLQHFCACVPNMTFARHFLPHIFTNARKGLA